MRLSSDTAHLIEINPGARPALARGAKTSPSLAEREGAAGLAARRQTAQETITIIDGSIPTEGVPTSRSIRQTQSGGRRLNPLARRLDLTGQSDGIGAVAASHEITEKFKNKRRLIDARGGKILHAFSAELIAASKARFAMWLEGFHAGTLGRPISNPNGFNVAKGRGRLALA